MTTTLPLTVAAIRRILNDVPVRDKLAGAITTTNGLTFTPTNASIYRQGVPIEFDDGSTGAEQSQVAAVDSDTPLITVLDRGMFGSTAATHLINTNVLLEPRFPYDLVAQSVNTVLDSELFTDGVYEMVEHQITSNAAADGNDYNAPSVNCEEFLSVFQVPSGTNEPIIIGSFSKLPRNIDPALYATGKLFAIWENAGIPGTDVYYVTCKHRLAIGTVSPQQERIVQYLGVANLLEWASPRRLQGPTNQGDRTVPPGRELQSAAYFRDRAARLINKERAYLRPYAFAGRRFVKVD